MKDWPVEALVDEIERLRKILRETQTAFIRLGLHQASGVLHGILKQHPPESRDA